MNRMEKPGRFYFLLQRLASLRPFFRGVEKKRIAAVCRDWYSNVVITLREEQIKNPNRTRCSCRKRLETMTPRRTKLARGEIRNFDDNLRFNYRVIWPSRLYNAPLHSNLFYLTSRTIRKVSSTKVHLTWIQIFGNCETTVKVEKFFSPNKMAS